MRLLRLLPRLLLLLRWLLLLRLLRLLLWWRRGALCWLAWRQRLRRGQLGARVSARVRARGARDGGAMVRRSCGPL